MEFISQQINLSLNIYEKSKFILAWRINILAILTFGLLSLIYSSRSFEELAIYLICLVLSVLTLIIFYLKKNPSISYYIVAILGPIMLFLSLNFLTRTISVTDYSWMISVVLITFFGLDKKIGLMTVSSYVLVIIYSTLFNPNVKPEMSQSKGIEENLATSVELIVVLLVSTYVIHQFIVINKKHREETELANIELIEQNQIIKAQNDEKTVLIKEIHHRVKNNLQIIISLLKLKKEDTTSLETKTHLEESIARIMAMSLIHQKLYSGDSLSKINLFEYFDELCNDISQVSNLNRDLEFDIDVQIKQLDLKIIIPLGLIMNELITNSIKHAFKEQTKPLISIKLLPGQNDKFDLIYFDNGKWKSNDMEVKKLGLELIEILTEQIDGEFTRRIKENGTEFKFHFL